MIAIYIRTSTLEQNPTNQLNDCKSLVGTDSYNVLKEYQSAFRDKDRPIFNSLKSDIKNRKVTKLICWDLDRLFRNRKKLIGFFIFCKMYNCKVLSFRQPWLNQFESMPSPFDEILFDLMLSVMGWIAEEESQKKSDRVKIAYKNHKGKKWGRPQKITDSICLEVIELHNKGMSIRNIAESVWVYDKNRNQKFISKSTVHKIISHKINNTA